MHVTVGGLALQGRKRIMLYTERAHFYHRYRINGIRVSNFFSMSLYTAGQNLWNFTNPSHT